MAISYKQLKENFDKEINIPLNEEELCVISNLEKTIDEKLTKLFKGKDLEVYIPEFDIIPKNLTFTRAKIAEAELIKRYKDSGWFITKTTNDGEEFVIFSNKK